jgi:hypothetical protein
MNTCIVLSVHNAGGGKVFDVIVCILWAVIILAFVFCILVPSKQKTFLHGSQERVGPSGRFYLTLGVTLTLTLVPILTRTQTLNLTLTRNPNPNPNLNLLVYPNLNSNPGPNSLSLILTLTLRHTVTLSLALSLTLGHILCGNACTGIWAWRQDQHPQPPSFLLRPIGPRSLLYPFPAWLCRMLCVRGRLVCRIATLCWRYD